MSLLPHICEFPITIKALPKVDESNSYSDNKQLQMTNMAITLH